MGKRGRPRQPGILTRREQQVLELVRGGLSNAEIAERLSLARETVKWHMSEILSKLGVETREEAAAWHAELDRSGRYSAMPLLLRLASGGVLAATVLGVAALGWAVVDTSGGAPDDGSVAEAAGFQRSPARAATPGEVSLHSTPTPTVRPPAPDVGSLPTPTPLPAGNAGNVFDPIPSATAEPELPSVPTPTRTVVPPSPTPSWENDLPIQPPTTQTPTPSPLCGDDWDCDGWPDEVELRYGSSAFWFGPSTPEHSGFDAEFGQFSCSDGVDNDGDQLRDGADTGCGGTGPTPPYTPPFETDPPAGP